MKFTTRGITFEYEDVGNGTPLLLIHGFPLDHNMWRSQIEGLQAAARLIAPDLRGVGYSGDAPEVMAMDDYAADLHALLHSLNIEQVILCGLSMGGYIALAFLAKQPEAVRGLILANTRAGADGEPAREARYANAKKALDEGVSSIVEAMLPKMLTEATLDHRPTLRTYVHTMMARQQPGGVAAALRGMAARPDRGEWIKSINVPTLIITSSQDALIPPGESEIMARAIAGSRLVILPEAAHLSNMENPDAFNAAVREFIGKV